VEAKPAGWPRRERSQDDAAMGRREVASLTSRLGSRLGRSRGQETLSLSKSVLSASIATGRAAASATKPIRCGLGARLATPARCSGVWAGAGRATDASPPLNLLAALGRRTRSPAKEWPVLLCHWATRAACRPDSTAASHPQKPARSTSRHAASAPLSAHADLESAVRQVLAGLKVFGERELKSWGERQPGRG